MEELIQILPAFAAGASGFALLWMWRKCAFRWNTWFPPLKKSIELLLSLFAILAGLAMIASVFLSSNRPIALVGILLGFVAPVVYSKLKGVGGVKEEIKRGTAVAPASDVARLVKGTKKPYRISLGDVPLPQDSEPYHLLVVGSTGTGKSVAINDILYQLRKANETVIIVDSGGDFLAKHFQEDTDFIFNPFDERCVNWSPTLEMQGEWDAESMARSIVPDGVGDSKEWNGYAQTLVSSVMRQLWLKKQMTLKDFLYYVQAATVEELQVLLKGTAAQAQLASARTFGSIRTIASNYLTPYIYLPNEGVPFSVSDMIRAEHSGFLYITYRDDQLDSLRGLIACVLDVAARSILSLKPDPDRRVWLVIDEFSSIGKIQSIEAVATKARKAGGCLLLGIQAVSQLKDRYGEHGAQSILSCLSTWLVLRCGDADTAEYMSKYIGDVEMLRQVKTSSVSDTGETQGSNEQQATQRAIMPSQIQSLPNLEGFLKLAGSFPICQIKLDVTKLPKNPVDKAIPFDARDFDARPLIVLSSPEEDAAAAAGVPTPPPPLATATPVAPNNAAQAIPKDSKGTASDALRKLQGALSNARAKSLNGAATSEPSKSQAQAKAQNPAAVAAPALPADSKVIVSRKDLSNEPLNITK